MIDPSSADMTGRTLAFISGLRDCRAAPARRRALAWLDTHQGRNGSWWGRWGISYIYGTWGALLGYGAVGVNEDDSRAVQKGCKWLRSVQNPDGGWGESCKSDLAGHFVPRFEKYALSDCMGTRGPSCRRFRPRTDPSVRRGIEFLLTSYRPGIGWEEDYPTGAGFTGKLYLIYHNYRNLWPTMALLRAIHGCGSQLRPTRCRSGWTSVDRRVSESSLIQQPYVNNCKDSAMETQKMTMQNSTFRFTPKHTRRILCVFPEYKRSFATFNYAFQLMSSVKAFMPPQGSFSLPH